MRSFGQQALTTSGILQPATCKAEMGSGDVPSTCCQQDTFIRLTSSCLPRPLSCCVSLGESLSFSGHQCAKWVELSGQPPHPRLDLTGVCLFEQIISTVDSGSPFWL